MAENIKTDATTIISKTFVITDPLVPNANSKMATPDKTTRITDT